MTEGPVTYGELTELALRQVAQWAAHMATRPLPEGGGLVAIVEHRQTLIALERHSRAVVATDRHPLVEQLDAPITEQDHALRAFLDSLARAVTNVRPGPTLRAVSWPSAARTWNAASDLLATHFTANGDPRSPDAAALDDATGQIAALSRVADATTALLAGHRHLRLRAAQAGMPWEQVEQALPDLPGLQDAARRAARRRGRTAWDDYGVARPGVAAGGGLRELASRVRRLRQSAWQLGTQPSPSVRPLGDIAVTAVAVHQLAAGMGAAGELLTQRSRDAAAAWVTVRDGLHHLCTATPCSNAVRVDANAIRRLAVEIDAAVAPAERDSVAVVRTVLDSFTDVAGWNQAVLERMAHRQALYLRGHYLTGDDITDHPDLVAAKLGDTLARIPPGHLERLTAAYERAATTPGHAEVGVVAAVPRRHDVRIPAPALATGR